MTENTITLIVVLGMGIVALVNRRWDRQDAAIKEKKAELAAEAARLEAARVAAAAHEAALNAQLAAKSAAVEAKKVKETLVNATAATDEKLNGLVSVAAESQRTGEAVHILVNSSMSAVMRSLAIALRRVAILDPHPDNEAAATLAEKLFHEHENKQSIVDVKEGVEGKAR